MLLPSRPIFEKWFHFWPWLHKLVSPFFPLSCHVLWMPALHWFAHTPRNARRFPPHSRGPLPILFRNCLSKIAVCFSPFRLLRYRCLSTFLCAIRSLVGMRSLHIINEIDAHILPFAHHASCMRCPCLYHANVHVFLNMTICLYVIHPPMM